MTETIGQRIYRNGKEILTTGKIDSSAVLNGINQIKDYVMTAGVEYAKMGEPKITEGYAGNPDMTVIVVPFRVGIVKEASIQIVEFPAQSTLTMEVTDGLLEQDYMLRNQPNAIAAITGPTVNFLRSPYPNNGFYVEGKPETLVPFGKTKDPAERRGAFAFTHKGDLHILPDDVKWEVIENNFQGYEAVIGTSRYFSSDDPISEIASSPNKKTICSYLVVYKAHELPRFAHVVTRNFVTPAQCKLVLDTFIQSRSDAGGHYLAAELELSGAFCAVKNNDTKTVHRVNPTAQHPRKDHYLIVPTPQPSS